MGSVMKHNYAYMQFSIANLDGLEARRCEEMFDDIAAAIAQVLEQHGVDDETSAYIMNDKDEAVY